MKKVIFALVIATSLVACGGASTETPATDSTTVAADTTVKVDSTVAAPVAPVTADSAK